jgi:hypothetical protein
MHRLLLVGGLAFILTGATPLAGQKASPLLPGTTERAFATIQGNALDSANNALPGGNVRLRDVRFGRVVDLQVTDQSGLFAFRTVNPGSYVVELIGTSESVVAASQVLHASAGEVVSAVVKLPFRAPPLAALFGERSHAGALAMLVSTAASSGILSVIAPGTPVSPQ